MVGPDYFDVMGTRIERTGHTSADTPGSAPVAVISQAMVRRLAVRTRSDAAS
jgi:hypothetical protein